MSNSSYKPYSTIISCPVFKGLIEQVLSHAKNINIKYLPENIHNNAVEFESSLIKNLASAKCRSIILAGAGCHCKTSVPQIAASYHASHAKEQNCFEILLGREKAKALLNSKTGIITKNWMRMIQNAISDGRYSRDDARIDFSYFDKVLLIDSNLNQLSDEDILTFFDIVRVPIETEEIDLTRFQKKIYDLIKGTAGA